VLGIVLDVVLGIILFVGVVLGVVLNIELGIVLFVGVVLGVVLDMELFVGLVISALVVQSAIDMTTGLFTDTSKQRTKISLVIYVMFFLCSVMFV
jgi:hypothetical protein